MTLLNTKLETDFNKNGRHWSGDSRVLFTLGSEMSASNVACWKTIVFDNDPLYLNTRQPFQHMQICKNLQISMNCSKTRINKQRHAVFILPVYRIEI